MPDGIIPLFNLVKCPGYNRICHLFGFFKPELVFSNLTGSNIQNLKGVQSKILNVYYRQDLLSPVNFPAGAEHADFIKGEQPERRI